MSGSFGGGGGVPGSRKGNGEGAGREESQYECIMEVILGGGGELLSLSPAGELGSGEHASDSSHTKGEGAGGYTHTSRHWPGLLLGRQLPGTPTPWDASSLGLGLLPTVDSPFLSLQASAYAPFPRRPS